MYKLTRTCSLCAQPVILSIKHENQFNRPHPPMLTSCTVVSSSSPVVLLVLSCSSGWSPGERSNLTYTLLHGQNSFSRSFECGWAYHTLTSSTLGKDSRASLIWEKKWNKIQHEVNFVQHTHHDSWGMYRQLHRPVTFEPKWVCACKWSTGSLDPGHWHHIYSWI